MHYTLETFEQEAAAKGRVQADFGDTAAQNLLASLFEITPARVCQLVRAGVLQTNPDGKLPLVLSVIDYTIWANFAQQGPSKGHIDFWEWRASRDEGLKRDEELTALKNEVANLRALVKQQGSVTP